MVEELRVLFTVLSFLTFLLIVWWAWRPSYKEKSAHIMEDVLRDDDRNTNVPRPKDEVMP